METDANHKKIIEILGNKGPSLPIQIAKEMRINSLFASAFLSELSREKRIKMSHLKVGGSPLYFLDGQEAQLENFYKFLHPKEAEAFLLLKEKNILKDSEQEPAIRVALRSIRDFAIGFKKDEEIFWRYYLFSESDVKDLFEPEKPKGKKEIVQKKESNEKPIKQVLLKYDKFKNPLVIEKKEKKKKSKSDFVEKVIKILKEKYKIVEEKGYKVKEYNCVVQIRSELGLINFLTQAKDKKKISETDLKKLLSNAQSIPLPALFVMTGEMSKKAKEFADKYYSILKVKKV